MGTNTIGCSYTSTPVTVTTGTPANAGTNGTLTVCEGTTVTDAQLFAALGGSPAAGGSWNPARTGAGTYTYTVAATVPCTRTATATVTVTTINKIINAGCYAATITRSYNQAAKSTTFTYNVCANGCAASLGYIAFITQTNLKVLTPLNGATYKTARNTYTVSVPVGTENGKMVYGIKYNLVKGTGIKNKGECDNYTFTLAGNISVDAITVRFKAGTLVTSAVSTCPLQSALPALLISKRPMQEQAISPGLNVKAYPNPYANKVSFEITSPEAGQGSLEVFNVLRQKVKTIYQGHIVSGTQTFGWNVPAGFHTTLIYRLSVNDKQVTGKLMATGN